MNRPKISVILPIYNVEPYIEECLDSILNQTMIDDIEVIMVDDGSSDDSRYAIERYALDYDNFHAYHKENEGSGIARNYGLEKANGEYIHFCDPDDYIKPDFYERIYEFAKSSPNADFVFVNSSRFGNWHIWEGILYKTTFENIDGAIESTNIRENTNFVWDTGVWNKLIKKDFLMEKNIRFPNENIVSQDLVFTIKLHCLANEIAANPDIYYYWRFRQTKDSVTQQKGRIKSFTDRLRVIELIREFFRENNIEEEILNAEYDKWLNHDLKDYIKRINEYPEEYHEEKLSEVRRILNDVPKYIKENLNSYKRIIYKMIEDDDYDGLLSFSYLENDLKKNPNLFELAGEDYQQYVNLERDSQKEELQAKREAIDANDEEILIDFSSYIPFVDGDDFIITASVVDSEDNEYIISNEDIVDATEEEDEISVEETDELETYSIERRQRVAVPLKIIKNLKHSRIKIKYESESISKETFLNNNRRATYVFEDYDVDIGIGTRKELYIDVRYKNKNNVRIHDIIEDDSKYTLIGSSQEKVENLKIQNLVCFSERHFPIQYLSHEEIIEKFYNDSIKDESIEEENGEEIRINGDLVEYEHTFIADIPFKDLFNAVIKKWEIGTAEFIDHISLSKNHYFYTSTHKTQIRNLRKKIVLEMFLIDYVKEMHEMKAENLEIIRTDRELKKENKKLKKENRSLKKEKKDLREENKELNKENKKLNEKYEKQKKLIEDYKNRKVIKLVDNLKK
ncbi:MAG: glycosyltransferase family 2 protein [archaeon]|nr:glycosyltransferase family 2 protein [archaeon]